MGSGTAVRLELGVEIEKKLLAKSGTREDIALVLAQRPDIIGQCADLIMGAARETKARLEFSITVKDGETFDSLVVVGKYDWKYNGITGKRFPVRKSIPGERKLVVVRFGRGISSEDVIAEVVKQGLERPTYEDCLRFGAQHPEVQLKFPVIFLHEPVKVGGDPYVLCLDSNGGMRYLDYCWFDNEWNGIYRFVFVRPPTAKP